MRKSSRDKKRLDEQRVRPRPAGHRPHRRTTTTLLFTASFDNNVLNLPVGTQTRAEIIVSFGNAKSGSTSSANVDINGNGIIDPDEAWVQSVSDHRWRE